MAVAGGFDLHRGQLTFDYVDTGTGESCRGRICPADRESLRGWLRRFDGAQDVAFAVEGCTGWRYVVLRREALFVRVEVRDLRRRPVAAGR